MVPKNNNKKKKKMLKRKIEKKKTYSSAIFLPCLSVFCMTSSMISNISREKKM